MHSEDMHSTAEPLLPGGKRTQWRGRGLMITSAIAATASVLIAASIFFFRSGPKDSGHILASQLAVQKVTIPVYYPKNLPGGYRYDNDVKVPKANVFYFSVTGPNRHVFYVSQESIPANFDFDKFNKKFLNPDGFSTDAGTTTAGLLGTNYVGSIRTNKNTWIIINTSAASSLSQLETVARSLELVD